VATTRTRSWAQVDAGDAATYRQVTAAHLRSLAAATGLSGTSVDRQTAVVDSVLGAWADAPVGDFDHHHSFTANDGSPVEFSMAFSRAGMSPRLLVEPLSVVADPASFRNTRAFAERLAETGAGDVGLLRKIEDLFEGDTFSLLYSAALRPGADAPLFKAYAYPLPGGHAPARAIGEAMARLGLAAQWAALRSHLDDRSRTAEVALLGLDLDGSADARVKVYLRHTGWGTEEIERVACIARDHRPGAVRDALGHVYRADPADLAKAPMTCFSFRGNQPAPDSVTLYCPLDPNLDSDLDADARIVGLLESAGLDTAAYRAAARLICGDDLARSRRLSWVGLKRPDDPEITVYAGLDGSPRGAAA
jgi:DMATS type aromatic prenyltransferase